MRILVTGHLGYIGTVLAPMLASRGHEVVGWDTDLFNQCTFGGSISKFPNINKDIRDVTPADLKGFDVVCHLAALSNDPLGNYDPNLTDEINRLGAVRFGEAAKEAGVRKFIFSSTCSNYGTAGDDFVDETSPLQPYTPYARAKVAAEEQLAPLGSDKFCMVMMRSATAFGYSPRIRFDLVLNNLTAYAATTKRIYMKSDGTPWRAIVHIEDISRAFTAVAEAADDVVNGQAFNVGTTSENYRVSEIAQIVAETVRGARIEYAPDAKPDPRCYRVNCDKLPRLVPAYRPIWTARSGASQVYAAILKNGLKDGEFEGARYARLPHVKKLIADGVVDTRFRHLQNAA
jgi:nucleoside-diphosphate-sugar epimerase